MAVNEAKRNKASGLDGIPVDVLKNDSAISFLHILFNVCFEKGVIPSNWGKRIINPIPKIKYRGSPRSSFIIWHYNSECSI